MVQKDQWNEVVQEKLHNQNFKCRSVSYDSCNLNSNVFSFFFKFLQIFIEQTQSYASARTRRCNGLQILLLILSRFKGIKLLLFPLKPSENIRSGIRRRSRNCFIFHQPHVDIKAGHVDAWPANATNKSTATKPKFLQNLEVYIQRELRALGCSDDQQPSEKRLQVMQ